MTKSGGGGQFGNIVLLPVVKNGIAPPQSEAEAEIRLPMGHESTRVERVNPSTRADTFNLYLVKNAPLDELNGSSH